MAAEYLLSDNRLSEAARILGVWILAQEHDGDGWVEVRFDDARTLLYGFPSDDTIRRHLRMLRGSKWAESRPGGRGHGDAYRMLEPVGGGSNKIDPGQERGYTPYRVGSGAGLNALVGSSSRDDVEGREMDVGARETERARRAIEQNDEKLSGCRKALEDYLEHYVRPENRGHYAFGVVGYMDNPARAFKRPNGTTIANHNEQAGIVSEALNELGSGGEQAMKWPVGDLRNLKTKISVIIQQETDGFHRSKHRDNGRTGTDTRGGTGAPRGAPPGSRGDRPSDSIPYESG